MPRKKFTKLDAIRLSPYRSVSWRYDRIMELLEHPNRHKRQPIRGIDDKAIFSSFDFIRKWEKAGLEDNEYDVVEKRRDLFLVNPGLYQAHEIFMKPSEDRSRGRLETYILGSMLDDEIANIMNLIEDTSKWYELLFFNIRDRIADKSYVVNQVIGPLVGAGLNNSTLELSAKFFAYFGNVALAETIMNCYNSSVAAPREGQSPDDYLDSQFKSITRIRSLPALQTYEINKYNVHTILEAHERLMTEHERVKSEGGGAKSTIEDNISVFLESLTWSVGQERSKRIAQSALQPYLGHTVEPRAVDQIRIASGESLDHLKDIETKTLPPPRKKDKE